MASEHNGENSVRIQFMNISEETRLLLANFWKVVAIEMPDILDGFYAHAVSVPALAKLVGGDAP